MAKPDDHPKAFRITGEKINPSEGETTIIRCKPYLVKHRPQPEAIYTTVPGVDVSRCPKCELVARVVDNRKTG